MASKYKKINDSKVEFSLKINEKMIQSAQAQVLEKYKKEVSVQGFRKGHAPDDMVIAKVGIQTLADEALNEALNREYFLFVKEEKLEIISQPEIELPKEHKLPMDVNFKVEVYPSIEIGEYKKVKMKQPKVEVTDKDIEEVLSTVLAQMEAGTEVKRAAKTMDLIEGAFEGKDDKGEVLPSTKVERHKFRIGMGHYLPDLEAAFEGMKAGDNKKKVKVKFPEDYHSTDFAGKTILFDIELFTVSEINPKKITEEQIEQIMGQKLSKEDFAKQIKENIANQRARDENQKVIDDYTREIGKITKGDLPQSWIKKEVEMQVKQLQENPQFKQNPEAFLKTLGKDTDALIKEFESKGVDNLRVFLGLSEIVEKEKIELDKDELAAAEEKAKKGEGDLKIEHDRISLNMKIDKYLMGLLK